MIDLRIKRIGKKVVRYLGLGMTLFIPAACYGPEPYYEYEMECSSDEECVSKFGNDWYCDKSLEGSWPRCREGQEDDLDISEDTKMSNTSAKIDDYVDIQKQN